MKRLLLIGAMWFSASAVFADDKETFNQMLAADTHGKAHDVLDDLKGKWEYTVKCWVTPESSPEEIRGKSEFSWVFERKFLFEDHRDQRMGISYQAQRFFGYDNGAKEYVMVQLDGTASRVLVARGKQEEGSSVITFHGEYVHPVSGVPVKTRTVLTIDRKEPKLEVYETASEGAEFKALEISYAKKVRLGA